MADAGSDASARSDARAEGTSWYERIGLPRALSFEDVYDNGMPSLRRLTLTNPSDQDITVHFPARAYGVRFAQREAADNGVVLPSDYATNTVRWAREGGLDPAQLRALRHLAANLATRVCLRLPPGGSVHVYVEVVVREFALPAPQDPGRHERVAGEQALDVPVECGGVTEHQRMTFQVSACAPELQVSARDMRPGSERGLALEFGDVVVGQALTREVLVTNACAIESYLVVRSGNADDTHGPVAVLDSKTGHPVDGSGPLPLAPWERRALTILLEPRASHANFEQTLTLESAHAAAQSTRVLVRANLLGAALDDALSVLSESPLDFGDCCGGQWARQLLVLKNPGDVLLDVAFRTDPGVEATFQLAELAAPHDGADDGERPSDDGADDDDVPLGGTSSSIARAAPRRASDSDSDGEGRSDSDDDVSSNASQAGSRAASPVPRSDDRSAADTQESTRASSYSVVGVPTTAPHVPPTAGGAVLSAGPNTHADVPRGGSSVAAYGVGPLTPPARARRMYDPMQMLRGGGESQHNQIEELTMRPGAQYRVVVSYRPPREPLDAEYSAGRLKTTTFRLYLDYTKMADRSSEHGRQRREIVCHTRTCTPFISLAPRVVDFGMANVGARKSAQVAVTNHSELETRVMLRFVSKVLSMYMDEIAVPARQTVELKMEFFPRRINDSYRKQITVMNLLNRDNDQILEVRARNVDLQRVSFHSLFYRILTPSGSNFLDFGDVNIHAPCVRSFGIENLCATRLALEFSVAHPEDLQLYIKSTQQPQHGERERRPLLKEQFLESIQADTPAPPTAPRKPSLEKQKKHVLALRRGSRGRATRRYGHSVTFRDSSLLHEVQYLDLASGPPRENRGPRRRSAHADDLSPPHAAPPAPPVSAAAPEKRSSDSSRSSSAAGHSESSRGVDASPALTGTWRRTQRLADPQEVAALDVDGLVAALESQPASLSTFFVRSLDAEERLVRTEVNLQRALKAAIERGQLVPMSLLYVPPHAVTQVVAVYTPNGSTRPHIQGKARKQDSRIFLRLLEFEARRATGVPEFEALRARDVDELPVRDLMVRSTVCRSMMELGQPHINFGHMDKGDQRERKIWIQNRSEWALRYCLQKSGSIASGDIKLGRGRYGIVPGNGKRGVDFTFSPSLSGPYCERLLVLNIADHDNDRAVVLKANVRKVANFALDPHTLAFGTCRAGTVSMPESVLISNTTGKQRAFVVRLQHASPALDVLVATSNDAATRRALSREEEEEVETLYQKLKIASRKGNLDKLAKYRERLTLLGVPIPSESPEGESRPSTPAAAEPEDLQHYTTLGAEAAETAPSLTVHLAAQRSQKLLVRVRGRACDAPHDVQLALVVQELKNSDETRTVAVHARVE